MVSRSASRSRSSAPCSEPLSTASSGSSPAARSQGTAFSRVASWSVPSTVTVSASDRSRAPLSGTAAAGRGIAGGCHRGRVISHAPMVAVVVGAGRARCAQRGRRPLPESIAVCLVVSSERNRLHRLRRLETHERATRAKRRRGAGRAASRGRRAALSDEPSGLSPRPGQADGRHLRGDRRQPLLRAAAAALDRRLTAREPGQRVAPRDGRAGRLRARAAVHRPGGRHHAPPPAAHRAARVLRAHPGGLRARPEPARARRGRRRCAASPRWSSRCSSPTPRRWPATASAAG